MINLNIDQSSEDDTAHLAQLEEFLGQGLLKPKKDEKYPLFKSKYIEQKV